GDYDPSGMFMSEVDLPRRLSDYGASDDDYSLSRIALTRNDLRGLPSFPASDKKKDPRHDWFVRHYSNQGWELDAMDPNTLRDRVQSHIERYVNAEDWEQHQIIEAVQLETTKRIARAIAQSETSSNLLGV